MAVPQPGMLSAIARDLSSFITARVDAKPQILIGPPAEAEPQAADAQPVINLFFFRFEPSAFYPDATVADPRHLRIHCLITAYASSTAVPAENGGTETLSGGEICLRLLEGVIQAFDEDPARTISVTRSNPVSGQQETLKTLLQIIFKPLSTEELSQIWATQGDTHYRTSVLYEFAVAPITPWTGQTPVQIVAEDGRVVRVEGSLAHAGGGE